MAQRTNIDRQGDRGDPGPGCRRADRGNIGREREGEGSRQGRGGGGQREGGGAAVRATVTDGGGIRGTHKVYADGTDVALCVCVVLRTDKPRIRTRTVRN